jgi:energy-coupling factor transporter ATP-binding protein EcfA2
MGGSNPTAPLVDGVRFTSVRFRRYKALADFQIALGRANVLVGPNNCGKSTVIGAFRILGAGLQKALAKRPELVATPEGSRLGYWIPAESIPVSLENAHTDYREEWSSITFRLSSGLHLLLHFPPDGGCALVPDPEGPVITGPSLFRARYPISVGVIPVLGAVEHEERLLNTETVRRGLATHRASAHFRNYWVHFPDGFDEFRSLLKTTWPNVDIERPRAEGGVYGELLVMYCRENRIPRELFWAGFGFQVWCQILSHLVRVKSTSMIVVDEPEIYLHPDLQRRLVGLLKDLGPDVLVATHSSEIVTEAEAHDLVMVDKAKRSASRVTGVDGVRATLKAIGSNQNVVLAQLARTRRVLYVEGEDFKVLRRLARLFGFTELASSIGVTLVPLGGFPAPEAVRALSDGIQMAVGAQLVFAGVFDSDYRSDEEIERVERALEATLVYCHIYGRKELENYLLVPAVLDRAIRAVVHDRNQRLLAPPEQIPPAKDLLRRATDDLRLDVQSQVVASHMRPQNKAHHRDMVTLTLEATERFERKWSDIDLRLDIVPGKRALSSLNRILQETYKVSLTPTTICSAFTKKDLSFEISTVLRELEAFRKMDPDAAQTVGERRRA